MLAALAAMVVVAALGLWAAGAADLPDSAYPRIVLATVAAAVGGTVRLSGNAGALARTEAGLTGVGLPEEAGGSANTIQNLNATIEINSNIVKVAANP